MSNWPNADVSQSYAIRNSDPTNGNTNISISGGIINGNCGGDGNTDIIVADEQGYYGQLIWIENVTNFRMHDVTFQDPGRWCTAFNQLTRAVIERIHFDNVYRDGLHFCGDIYDLLVQHITGTTGDNTIALSTRQNISQGQAGGYFSGEYNNIDGTILTRS